VGLLADIVAVHFPSSEFSCARLPIAFHDLAASGSRRPARKLVRILSAAAYVAASLAFSWLFVQGVGWDRETARLVAVVGQLEIVLLVAAVLVRQSFSPLQRAYTWVGSFMRTHWLSPVSPRARM